MAALAKFDQHRPETMAFLAMTQYQLGRTEQAQKNFARMQAIMKVPRSATNDESLAIVREAAKLIEGKSMQR